MWLAVASRSRRQSSRTLALCVLGLFGGVSSSPGVSVLSWVDSRPKFENRFLERGTVREGGELEEGCLVGEPVGEEEGVA
jgi:hypothetical protein